MTLPTTQHPRTGRRPDLPDYVDTEPLWLTGLRSTGRRMPVIMFGGLKGGLGKTTSAWNTLQALAALGFDPLGVDADPMSQSLIDSWRMALKLGLRVPFTVASWPEAAGMRQGVEQLMRTGGHNALVFDTGATAPEVFDAAAELSGELIVPSATTQLDIRRLPATFSAAQKIAAALNRDLAVSVLLVKARANSIALRNARIFLEGLDDPMPVLATTVPGTLEYQQVFGNLDGPGVYAKVLDEVMSARVAAAVVQ